MGEVEITVCVCTQCKMEADSRLGHRLGKRPESIEFVTEMLKEFSIGTIYGIAD